MSTGVSSRSDLIDPLMTDSSHRVTFDRRAWNVSVLSVATRSTNKSPSVRRGLFRISRPSIRRHFRLSPARGRGHVYEYCRPKWRTGSCFEPYTKPAPGSAILFIFGFSVFWHRSPPPLGPFFGTMRLAARDKTRREPSHARANLGPLRSALAQLARRGNYRFTAKRRVGIYVRDSATVAGKQLLCLKNPLGVIRNRIDTRR